MVLLLYIISMGNGIFVPGDFVLGNLHPRKIRPHFGLMLLY